MIRRRRMENLLNRTFRRPAIANWSVDWKLSALIFYNLLICTDAISSVVKVFQNPDYNSEYPFQHMVVERQVHTGRVFVAGVNRLYQLSPDLDMQVRVETGPVEDVPECSTSPCDNTKRPINNYNKALLVYPKRSKLIVCGSANHGQCKFRTLINISEAEPPSNVAVVANDAESSSVVFVAPGPMNNDSLYVGSTYTGLGKYSDEVPAVATLSLEQDRLFSLAAQSINAWTKMLVDGLNRRTYRIEYVHGFSSGNYSYFVIRQPKYLANMPTPYHSKLVRLCNGDSKYYSYTEVPLECTKDGVDYNLVQAAYVTKAGFDLARDLNIDANDDVLYAVFAKAADVTGTDRSLSTPSRQSALCVYSLKQIDEKFMDNIVLCANGSMMRGLSHFKPDKPCWRTGYTRDVVACGYEVNYPVGGNIPIQRTAAIVSDNVRLTAVAATTTHMYTVAFLGTAEGKLKKVVIEKAESAFEYDTIDIDPGRAILPDLQFDMSGEFINVLTEASVSKAKVQVCEQKYQKCGQCLEARDPYCGWCSAKNKCMVQESCGVQHWLPYKDSQCTKITRVTPDKLQITAPGFVVLDIQNLQSMPDSGQLSCLFVLGNKDSMTSAQRKGDTSISCPAPETYLRQMPKGEHFVVASLSVQLDNGPELATTNFTFYDCATYKNCHDCVNSDFLCDWCAETVTCVSSAEDSCNNHRFINGISRQGVSSRKGPSFCPRIAPVDEDPVTYVPSGTSRALSVKVLNTMEFQQSFSCQFEIGPSVHKRPGKLVGDRLECESMDFTYFDNTPNETARLSVVWGEGKALDNVDSVRVVMYKCEKLATNCGLCLNLDLPYQCGWCSGQQTCLTENRCKNGSWMDKSEVCSGPKITKFSPQSGPFEGGTNVTIEGINLGRTFNDIVNAVRINNVPCTALKDQYVPSTKIVCITGQANQRDIQSMPIVVKIKDLPGFYALSDPGFTYVDPVIKDFYPIEGPQSGGTVLTIVGDNLNAGSNINARVGGIPCDIIKIEKTQIYCRTGASKSSQTSGDINMNFDLASKIYNQKQFTYSADPIITKVMNKSSIVSGGIYVKLEGDRFNYLQSARMYIIYGGQEYWSKCEVKLDGNNASRTIRAKTNVPMYMYIECLSPSLPVAKENQSLPTIERPWLLDYGFALDGMVIGGGRNGSSSPPSVSLDTKFSIYPDPVFVQFPRQADGRMIKRFHGPYLQLDGHNLNLAASSRDVNVLVGGKPCDVFRLNENQLLCTLPQKIPSPDDGLSSRSSFTSEGYPEVVVRLGPNLSYSLGYLNFDDSSGSVLAGIPKETIAAVAAAVCAFIIAIIIIVFIYRRKSTRQQRQMKTLKEQIDAIELKVASECKEAFAELQTNMTEMTAAVDNLLVAIPFLSHRDYAVQVLFPNTVNNPIDKQLEVEPHKRVLVEKGLRMFNQLLMNKSFLLTFIRTMEANKYFLSKDKVAVGSLLMVILHEKLGYATEILKCLLSELICRTVERGCQPKVLFRRSECVAERMLATWFTFLMHGYLNECAGQPLFMLYWAIKQQVEKGPQDALLHEARYSLSEEKLIRNLVEFHALMAFVSGPDGSAETPVRLLNCDTITQVKEKCLDAIFRTTPYSRRPSASDLDLEWRTGVSGRLLLQDLDVTTKPEPGGWKRLNTLSHYKVPNNATLALVPKQSSLYNLSLSSEKSSVLSLKNSPTLNRTLSPLTHNQKDPESGYKIYHLVKPSNDQHDVGNAERGTGKMVSEIYLTRLLTTKGTLQKFVEDLFEAIFSTAHRGSTLPMCIKYMFDFMDEQANLYNINDRDVVHAWKSNSLPLRFWVNLIKNPHFVFDIARPAKIEGCLSVVAQTLMDSCSTQDPQLTKDSPSSKLLFARDIHTYRDWVDRYYRDIEQMQPISDQDMNAFLAEESRQHQGEFGIEAALYELYQYLDKYKNQVAAALEEDEACRRTTLLTKFDQMLQFMQGVENGAMMGGTLPAYPIVTGANTSMHYHGQPPPAYHQTVYNQSSLR